MKLSVVDGMSLPMGATFDANAARKFSSYVDLVPTSLHVLMKGVEWRWGVPSERILQSLFVLLVCRWQRRTEVVLGGAVPEASHGSRHFLVDLESPFCEWLSKQWAEDAGVNGRVDSAALPSWPNSSQGSNRSHAM